jgi:hypothetical protein
MAITRRKFWETKERANGHSSKQTRKLDSTAYTMFAFETVLFLFARSFDNSRIKSVTDLQKGTIHRSARRRAFPLAPLRRLKSPKVSFSLRGEEADHSVDSSPCALHSAVRDVLRCNCRVLRDVSRRADRARFNAADANSEPEND